MAPTTPASLRATPVSTSAIELSWSPSSDDRGVVRYGEYRNGSEVGEVTATALRDEGLAPASTQHYTVDAWDAAGNSSSRAPEVVATTLPETPSIVFPLKVGADGHHLTDQQGKAFLLTADTCWTLLSRVSLEDAPFEAGDLSRPREAYWAGVDDIIDYAASQGMLLIVGTLWHSSNGGRSGTLPSTSEAASYAAFLGARYRSLGIVYGGPAPGSGRSWRQIGVITS